MLASCARCVSKASVWSTASSGSSSSKTLATRSAKSHANGSSSKLLKGVAMRKYSTAAEDATKKMNIELNRLYKLRYYEQAHEQYEKLKQAGATPDATTYLIMFDNYVAYEDTNMVEALLDDIQAKGIKTTFIDRDTQLQQALHDESREGQYRALSIHETILRHRKAGINPFESPK